MGIGLLLMILSVIIQAYTLVKLNTICQPSDQKSASSSIIRKLVFAFALVAIRAASFLSNSYICESDELIVLYAFHFMYICWFLVLFFCCPVAEGRVANFLLATSCITSMWHSMVKGKFSIEVSIPELKFFIILFILWCNHLLTSFTLLIYRTSFFFFSIFSHGLELILGCQNNRLPQQLQRITLWTPFVKSLVLVLATSSWRYSPAYLLLLWLTLYWSSYPMQSVRGSWSTLFRVERWLVMYLSRFIGLQRLHCFLMLELFKGSEEV